MILRKEYLGGLISSWSARKTHNSFLNGKGSSRLQYFRQEAV